MKNISRIIVGSLIGVVFFTVILLLLKERTTLVWVSYAWIVFGFIGVASALGYWAKTHKEEYILRAVYPMIVHTYLILTIIVAAIAVILEIVGFNIDAGWVSLIEFLILGITAWRLMAVDAAKDEIVAVDQQVKMSTISWKLLRVEIANVAENISGADMKVVQKAADAVRYADPVEHEAVADIVEKIGQKIDALKAAVAENKSETIAQLCADIERLVKERSNKLMVLK